MERSRIGIVIPALNEASTIAHVVRSVSRYGVPWVVDDGSEDATAQIALDEGACVVTHSHNQGYDQALNSGFSAAYSNGCQVLITLDADGQHDPHLLPQMLKLIDDGADLVIGVRSRFARLAEYIFAFYTKTLFGISDPLCGLKAYRASVYAHCGHFDSFKSIGTELTLYAASKRLRIEQLPFKVRTRNDNPRFGSLLWLTYLLCVRLFYLLFVH